MRFWRWRAAPFLRRQADAIVFAGVVVFVGLFTYFIAEAALGAVETGDPSAAAALGPIAISVAAVSATAGWVYSNLSSKRAARVAHTLSLLMQFRTSDAFTYHRANYYHHGKDRWIKHGSATFQDLVEMREEQQNCCYFVGDMNKPVYPPLDSIQFVANFYEFVLASMHRGDVDHAMFYNTARGLMVRFYQMFEVVILFDRQFDEKGRPQRRTYQHLEAYARRWVLEEDAFTPMTPQAFLALQTAYDASQTPPPDAADGSRGA